jgi:hypothetical protein
MTFHKYLFHARHLHKAKENFIPTHDAIRRVYIKPTEDHANINPLTGERINPTDSADYIDYKHGIVVSTKSTYRDEIEEKFGSLHHSKVNIWVHPNVKNLTKQDLWLVKDDTLAYTNWYRAVEVTEHRVNGVLIRHEVELEPIVGNKFGDEDF